MLNINKNAQHTLLHVKPYETADGRTASK